MTATFITKKSINPKLIYIFDNEPNSFEKDTMKSHYGTTNLDYNSPDSLKGTYYTDNQRRTHGKIELNRIENK